MPIKHRDPFIQDKRKGTYFNPESIELFTEDQAFLQSYDPAPPPLLQSASCLPSPVFLCVSDRAYQREGGGGRDEKAWPSINRSILSALNHKPFWERNPPPPHLQMAGRLYNVSAVDTANEFRKLCTTCGTKCGHLGNQGGGGAVFGVNKMNGMSYAVPTDAQCNIFPSFCCINYIEKIDRG
jgi:hypothetical protein